jgi:outer membrane protein OmpA-like peptidoglycan-associated protein
VLNYEKNIVTRIKILFLLFSMQLFSQNLVLNPSFEETKRCAVLIGNFDRNVKHWSTPTWGTTDIFSTCAKGTVGIPNNYNGIQETKSGNNYAGFYLHSDENYREYIQVELSEKLDKGINYKLSFYVNLAGKSDFAIKNIDFMLSADKLNTTISRELSEKQLKKFKIDSYSIYKIDNTRFYDNSSNWTLISREFNAQGTEQFLTIGNFNKNSKTDKILVSNKNRFNISYYYIDLISLERTDLPKIKNEQNTEIVKEKTETEKIELNKDYSFTNVVFNFNSIELSENAKSEIKSIYKFLVKNPETRILISGHTDNVGTSIFNQNLSENRAKSIANFLVSLGLDNGRISAIGYGNTYPISTNETEKGRDKNRRVSFKIVEK